MAADRLIRDHATCTPAPHALVLPSSGQGHVNGAMQLSQSLAPLGFHITFVYFSTSYSKLSESKRLVLPNPEETAPHPPTSSSSSPDHQYDAQYAGSAGTISIHVVQDGFGPGDADKHFFVTPDMKDNLYKLIVELGEQGHPPTCLISDSFVPWTVEVAQRARIPRIEFWTSNAMSHLLVTHLSTLFSEGIFPDKASGTRWKKENPLMLNHIPGLPPFSSELMPSDLASSDISHPFVQFFSQVGSCVKFGERILIHSMLELEPTAFKAFEVQGVPAYAIGPLPSHTKKRESEQPACISWLNLQEEASVIFVAFGSFASLQVEELQELAMGLEASGHPFLWVIREDTHKREELPQVLPDGFLERTSRKGLIISWAPQVEVLAHKAIGGFLSHCGWNSTIESMWEGVPMLCCPRFAEQRLNCHYLCDVWGAGLELGRTDNGGVERKSVESGVRALLHGEEGSKARSKAQEIMQIARKTCQPGGHSFTNLQKFYDDMRELSSKPHVPPK